MRIIDSHRIAGTVKAAKNFIDLRVPYRLLACVRQEVLLRHISDVFGFFIFCEQMIKRLVFARAHLSRG